ncbi:MAG TPA: sulfatase-like hydrolase/transferase, partial [Actinomycetota bacterium]|nr:sulfatase-like hydrolase/transferase [Actinomycetota bacterium]
MADRPNVLLVLMDTARADAFEPWGAPAGSTPVVAELARRGTAFPMAVAPSSWTVPSHASMFTGLLPRAFGFTPGLWAPRELRTRMRSLFDRHRDRTLAEVLRHGGYATGAVSTNPIVNSATGFSTGFDWFGDPGRTRFTRLQRQRQRAAARRGPAGAARRARDRAAWWRARDDNGAVHAGRALRRWLDHSGGAKPFFAFVNLMETHRPYYPPRPWNDLGPAARWQAVGDVFRWQGHIEVVLVS